MSYDIMIFDPAHAPRDREAFSRWFAEQVDWDEAHDYMNPKSATAAVRRWYDAIRTEYPAMNGPDATDDDDEIDRAGDYNFGPHFAYVTYPWSLAEEIYDRVRALAVETQVGFYDVSNDEDEQEIYFPGDALAPPSQGRWRSIAKQFRELSENQ
jgi:hypothetical protein